MSINEVCIWISRNVQDTKVRDKLVGLIIHGHECRTALCSLSSGVEKYRDLIDKYDDVWLE